MVQNSKAEYFTAVLHLVEKIANRKMSKHTFWCYLLDLKIIHYAINTVARTKRTERKINSV